MLIADQFFPDRGYTFCCRLHPNQQCRPQYPLAEKCKPVTRFSFSTVRWVKTALLPLRNPITKAMLNFIGTLMHICTWSDIKCPSKSSTPRCRHNSFNISPTLFRNFQCNFFFRNFGINTTWYLQSHLTWDKLCQSCIGNSFCIGPHRAFPRNYL